MRVCKKVKLIFDPTPYLYPRNDQSNEDPLSDFASFGIFFDEMPFFTSKADDFKQTLYFQIREVKKIAIGLISSIRVNNFEHINIPLFLKLL